MSTATVNFIGPEVSKQAPPGQEWSIEASQSLARDIAAKVNTHQTNIRIVQKGDNLGRIAEGLSGHAIKLIKEGGVGWENVEVRYLGNSSTTESQRNANTERTLLKANLIHPGQFVAIQGSGRVLVADTVELILTELSK